MVGCSVIRGQAPAMLELDQQPLQELSDVSTAVNT